MHYWVRILARESIAIKHVIIVVNVDFVSYGMVYIGFIDTKDITESFGGIIIESDHVMNARLMTYAIFFCSCLYSLLSCILCD